MSGQIDFGGCGRGVKRRRPAWFSIQMPVILGKFTSAKLLLVLASAFLFAGCGTQRVHTVKIESEANQIIGVLGENGIRAKKKDQGEGERKTFDIVVDSEDELAAAIQLMEDHCLGRPDPPEPEGGPMVTSVEVEKAKEQRRLKMAIETQLRKLPGATCVDVNFVPPQDRALALDPYKSSASVLINYKSPTFQHTKEEVQALVAGSVPALTPDRVEVMISAKPLRPLPENKIAYNFARIALVSGIGLATVLVFVSAVFFLRKKRAPETAPADESAEPESHTDDTPLLEQNYDDDDEDDENLG
jgi:type III secretory pathway lipoprotein EscJ